MGIIGRNSIVGQSAASLNANEERHAERYSGANVGRDHGAATAEQHLRAIVREQREEIGRLTVRVAELEGRLAKKRRVRKPRTEHAENVRPYRARRVV